MTTMRFFAIGSWTEGMLHFEKLKPFIVSFERATVRASVYRLPVGFPVLVAQKDSAMADTVQGDLLELNCNETLLALMDSMHGVLTHDPTRSLFHRLKSFVSRDSGELIEAQVYFLNDAKLPNKAVKIKDGVWKDNLAKEPPLTVQMTDRQKAYVLKLGAAKNREIIPIQDLSLYRELMKLELIVDKGRRLALSSLGKEVYKFLV